MELTETEIASLSYDKVKKLTQQGYDVVESCKYYEVDYEAYMAWLEEDIVIQKANNYVRDCIDKEYSLEQILSSRRGKKFPPSLIEAIYRQYMKKIKSDEESYRRIKKRQQQRGKIENFEFIRKSLLYLEGQFSNFELVKANHENIKKTMREMLSKMERLETRYG